jgi:hypothetical protein
VLAAACFIVPGTSYTVGERGFIRETFSKQKGEPLNGRNIYDRALTAIAMFKLAMKYHNEFCPNGKLPSGKTLEDLLLHVRQKMFMHLKGAKNNKSNARTKVDREGNEIVLTEDDLPAKWIFHGWFTFVLFCPQGLSDSSLSCLSDNGSNVPKQSRAETRAKEASVEMVKRRSNNEGNRGISAQDQIAFATLEQAAFKKETKNIQDLIYYTTIEEGNQLKGLELLYGMMEKATSETERHFLQKRKESLLERLDELNDRRRRLEAESDSLRMSFSTRSTGTTHNVASFPNQVSIEQRQTHTSTSSSISVSGSSTFFGSSTKKAPPLAKEKAIKKTSVDLQDSTDSSDDEDILYSERMKNTKRAKTTNSTTVHEDHCEQSSTVEHYQTPDAAAKPRPSSKTEQELNAASRAVLDQFRAKQHITGPQHNFGLDYLYDYE